MSLQKQYSIRWSEEMTMNFINARIENDILFTNGKFYNNKDSSEKVGVDADISEPWQKLRKKWSNIMDRYKKIIQPPTGSGTEYPSEMANSWQFFEIIHNYASNKHNINPVLITESCPSQVMTPSLTSSTSSQQHTSTSGNSCSTTRGTKRSSQSSRRSIPYEPENVKKLREAVLNVSDVFLQFMVRSTRSNGVNESDDCD